MILLIIVPVIRNSVLAKQKFFSCSSSSCDNSSTLELVQAQAPIDMPTQFSDLGPVDSTLETFKNVFATSSVFFITLGLLIVFTRLCVRLTTANYWGALTPDQSFVVGASSFVLAFSHLFLSLAYTFEDLKEFATAPSFYLAVCWSTATLSGVCGGLGVGLLVLIGMMRTI